MNHTNEQLARIYGAYMGCEVIGEDKRNPEFKKVYGTLLNLCDYYIAISTDAEAFECCYHESKLLLTPLSRITDEHALELGKKYGWDEDFNPFGGSGAPLPDDEVIDVVKYHAGVFGFGQKEVDTLRKWGYDCGFEEIASLIEAGIALDKTTLNDTEHGK